MVVFFRTDIYKIAQGVGAILKRRHKDPLQVKLFLLIIIATIPTGFMGLLFKDWFESLFSRPKVVGGMLLITGLVLWLTRWTKKEGRALEQMRWIDAILIGIAQGSGHHSWNFPVRSYHFYRTFSRSGSGTLWKILLSSLNPCHPRCNTLRISEDGYESRTLDNPDRYNHCFWNRNFILALSYENH